jgi:predicted RNA binding protein with dsRBD fold (UPF0201 family)
MSGRRDRDPGAEDALDAREAREAPATLADVVVRVRTPLYPTEDATAVRRAVAAVLPRVGLEHGEGCLEGAAEGPVALARLRRRLREMQVRDAARAKMARGIEGGAVTFRLNKQAATVGIASFATDGAPLGDIEVRVEGARPADVLEWMCELEPS